MSIVTHVVLDWSLSYVARGSEISTLASSCGVTRRSHGTFFCPYSLHAVCVLEFFVRPLSSTCVFFFSLLEKLIWETKNLEG